MNYKTAIAAGFALFTVCGSALANCTFHWEHYGNAQVYKIIDQNIGNKVTDEYCAKLNKTHEIVIITDAFNDVRRTLVHVAVGFRKRGSNDYPIKNLSAYKFEDGNFVVGKKYQMAADLALETLMDAMSAPDDVLN